MNFTDLTTLALVVVSLAIGFLLGWRPRHTRPLMFHLVKLVGRVYAPALDEPQHSGIQPMPNYHWCREFFWDTARYLSKGEREELLDAINKVHQHRSLPPFALTRQEWEQNSGERRSIAIVAG